MIDVQADPNFLIESRIDHLYARVVTETINAEILISIFGKLVPICKENGTENLLIEHFSGGKLTATDAFDAAIGILELDISTIKIAYVDPDPSHLENLKFGELVAVNRGARGMAFSDIEEAKDWLLN